MLIPFQANQVKLMIGQGQGRRCSLTIPDSSIQRLELGWDSTTEAYHFFEEQVVLRTIQSFKNFMFEF